MTPGPQTGDSHLTSEIAGRKRASEQLAELEREQKRARTAAASRGQFARQPGPFLEDLEDQHEGLNNESGRHDRGPITTQPGSEAQATSNAAGKTTDAAPSRVVTDSEQGLRNAQPGKLQVPTEALERL